MRSLVRHCTAFGITCLVAFGSAARAAEVTLYEHADYGGRQLTLRGTTPSFAPISFNDIASSAVVVSGRWEFCSDAEFKGYCQTFNRGEYPQLDSRLNDRVSSAREVGSYSGQTGGYDDYGRGAIQLFGQPNFAGRELQLTGDANELASRGFNNRASSVVVTAGTWELCSDADFGGTCRRYGPGRYPDLGYGMAKEISSAQLVRSARSAPAVVSPGYGVRGASTSAAPVAGARAILFSEAGLRGSSLTVAGPLGDLDRSNFSGAAKSLYVEAGSWVLCSSEFFRGNCRVFGPGRYDNLAALGFDRPVASIRPGDAGAPSPAPVVPRASDSAGIELFSEPDFGGARLEARRDAPNLESMRFNDQAASLVIYSGQWELCTDAQYGGSCAVFAPGRYARLGGMTRQLSSLRRIQ